MNNTKSNEPLRLSMDLRIPEGSSYEEILGLAIAALSSNLRSMPASPAPGVSVTVRDGETAIGGIHLRGIRSPTEFYRQAVARLADVDQAMDTVTRTKP